ncbi:MAG: hypothetical protein IMZ44_11940 [Planctomycetes bacterium]|nr:hypothetical protein [Planctomycetota bacterium]
MRPATAFLRVPAAPALADVGRAGTAAMEPLMLGLRGLLREAEESSPAGEVVPAETSRTEAVVSQPRAIERPRRTVD